jgi:Cytochrome C and Quinol oxidase polypeptide I
LATTDTGWMAAPPGSRPLVDRLHGWVTTVDHKRLGILYVVYGLFFLVVGGIEATVLRLQLLRPHNDFVSPQVFNQLFTMHGTTMIFFVAMPIMFGFANYLIPLMIGARDMAFPRLNAFSFWLTAFSGLFLYFSFVGGFGLYRRIRGGHSGPTLPLLAEDPRAPKGIRLLDRARWRVELPDRRDAVGDVSQPGRDGFRR